MITNKRKRSPNHAFGAGAILIILMTICTFQINLPAGMARSVLPPRPGAPGKGAIFDIIPTPATAGSSVVAPGSTPGATFFLIGKIYRYRTVNQADCTLPASIDCAGGDDRCLGTWRAWGTVGDDGKLVLHHTLELKPFDSTIEVQGTTGELAANGGVASAVAGSLGPPTTGPSEVLAVVGGTGRYKGLSGEANIRPYCNPTAGGTSPFRYDRAFCLGVE